jgi:hypothetical protein
MIHLIDTDPAMLGLDRYTTSAKVFSIRRK